MKYFKHLIIILITIFSANAFAGYSTQMTPTHYEMLNDPIALEGVCSKVKIVEWRGYGSMELANLNRMIKNCKIAMVHFPEFVKSRGYKIKKSGNLHTSVCLMPVDSNPRNLNDSDYRFSTRTKTYDEYGNVDEIWGYFQRYTNHIYMRGSAASDYQVIFVHELFHAASYYYGIYDQHKGNKDLKDENLAQDFTIHIGYGI